MAYVKGQYDAGELAGKYVVIVDTEDPTLVRNMIAEIPFVDMSIHEIAVSHFDIDYNVHKLILQPGLAVKKVEGAE